MTREYLVLPLIPRGEKIIHWKCSCQILVDQIRGRGVNVGGENSHHFHMSNLNVLWKNVILSDLSQLYQWDSEVGTPLYEHRRQQKPLRPYFFFGIFVPYQSQQLGTPLWKATIATLYPVQSLKQNHPWYFFVHLSFKLNFSLLQIFWQKSYLANCLK